MNLNNTIFALASATGKAGIAVIRISGSRIKDLFGTILPTINPTPRVLYKAIFRHPKNQEKLDYGFYVYFKAPKSYTGEECLEIYCHGGSATITALLNALAQIAGYRLAEPGEFTRRGYTNNKFDLTQAESIIDLIEAETDNQRRSALAQSEGNLYKLYMDWCQQLMHMRAYVEACLDFVDEDLPQGIEDTIINNVNKLHVQFTQHHNTAQRGERLKLGTESVIIGPSNAGKSSLLNHFTQHPSAIVSPIAGTTRDNITHYIDFYGYALNVTDTAGFQLTENIIEQEGIRRAKLKAKQVDLIFLIVDATKIPENLTQFMLNDKQQKIIVIINKIDLLKKQEINIPHQWTDIDVCYISLKNQSGISNFHQVLQSTLQQLAGYDNKAPIITHVRYQQALSKILSSFERIQNELNSNTDWLLILAEELRLAQNSLEQIIGQKNQEGILDIIFSRFCIGK